MDMHVRVIGWLWIANGALSILMLMSGLTVVVWPGVIPDAGDTFLVASGALCFFLPGIIADLVAGYGVLQFKNWGRILVIILAVFNLVFLCYLILPAVLGIYTLIIMLNKETATLFRGEVTTA